MLFLFTVSNLHSTDYFCYFSNHFRFTAKLQNNITSINICFHWEQKSWLIVAIYICTMTIYSFIVGWGWVSTSGFKNEADTSFFPTAFLQSLLYHHHLAYLVNIFFLIVCTKFHKNSTNSTKIRLQLILTKKISVFIWSAQPL